MGSLPEAAHVRLYTMCRPGTQGLNEAWVASCRSGPPGSLSTQGLGGTEPGACRQPYAPCLAEILLAPAESSGLLSRDHAACRIPARMLWVQSQVRTRRAGGGRRDVVTGSQPWTVPCNGCFALLHSQRAGGYSPWGLPRYGLHRYGEQPRRHRPAPRFHAGAVSPCPGGQRHRCLCRGCPCHRSVRADTCWEAYEERTRFYTNSLNLFTSNVSAVSYKNL